MYNFKMYFPNMNQGQRICHIFLFQIALFFYKDYFLGKQHNGQNVYNCFLYDINILS